MSSDPVQIPDIIRSRIRVWDRLVGKGRKGALRKIARHAQFPGYHILVSVPSDDIDAEVIGRFLLEYKQDKTVFAETMRKPEGAAFGDTIAPELGDQKSNLDGLLAEEQEHRAVGELPVPVPVEGLILPDVADSEKRDVKSGTQRRLDSSHRSYRDGLHIRTTQPLRVPGDDGLTQVPLLPKPTDPVSFDSQTRVEMPIDASNWVDNSDVGVVNGVKITHESIAIVSGKTLDVADDEIEEVGVADSASEAETRVEIPAIYPLKKDEDDVKSNVDSADASSSEETDDAEPLHRTTEISVGVGRDSLIIEPNTLVGFEITLTSDRETYYRMKLEDRPISVWFTDDRVLLVNGGNAEAQSFGEKRFFDFADKHNMVVRFLPSFVRVPDYQLGVEMFMSLRDESAGSIYIEGAEFRNGRVVVDARVDEIEVPSTPRASKEMIGILEKAMTPNVDEEPELAEDVFSSKFHGVSVEGLPIAPRVESRPELEAWFGPESFDASSGESKMASSVNDAENIVEDEPSAGTDAIKAKEVLMMGGSTLSFHPPLSAERKRRFDMERNARSDSSGTSRKRNGGRSDWQLNTDLPIIVAIIGVVLLVGTYMYRKYVLRDEIVVNDIADVAFESKTPIVWARPQVDLNQNMVAFDNGGVDEQPLDEAVSSVSVENDMVTIHDLNQLEETVDQNMLAIQRDHRDTLAEAVRRLDRLEHMVRATGVVPADELAITRKVHDRVMQDLDGLRITQASEPESVIIQEKPVEKVPVVLPPVELSEAEVGMTGNYGTVLRTASEPLRVEDVKHLPMFAGYSAKRLANYVRRYNRAFGR